MSLHQLLRHVSEDLGIPELALNSNGVCQINVDEGVTLSIEDLPSDGSAQIYATVANASQSERETLFSTLLEAQLFGREIGDGMAFGLERSSGDILLCRKIRVDGADPEAFGMVLNEFVAWAEHWQKKLSQLDTDPVADVSSEHSMHFLRA